MRERGYDDDGLSDHGHKLPTCGKCGVCIKKKVCSSRRSYERSNDLT